MLVKICTCIAALTIICVGAGAAQATPQTCLQATASKAVNTSQLLAGLNLTPEQVKAARARLSQYGGYNYQGLDGIGLSPAQVATIQKRLAAMKAGQHPAGWPCPPFQNRSRVIKWMRAKLISDGFRPAMTFHVTSPRQVQFNAIQDGVQMYGVVVKAGTRRITVSLDTTQDVGFGQTISFNLPFNA